MIYYSKPVEVKAIQFAPDGSNYDEVIKIVRLNKGVAELTYLTKDGHAAPRGTITAYKAIALLSTPGGPFLPVMPGDFIILNAENEMYPVPENLFKQYHVASMEEIPVGSKTLGDLLKDLQKMNPTFEQVVEADKFIVDADMSASEFVEANGINHTSRDGDHYYVINGQVYLGS